MKKLLVTLTLSLLCFSLVGCTQPDNSIAILEREGYQNIEITGYDWFGCSEDDVFRTGFTATKNDRPVKGVVCSAWLKGSTIRTY